MYKTLTCLLAGALALLMVFMVWNHGEKGYCWFCGRGSNNTEV